MGLLKEKIKKLIFGATSDTRDIMEFHFRQVEEALSQTRGELSELREQIAAIAQQRDMAQDQAEAMHLHLDYMQHDVMAFLAQSDIPGNPLQTQRVRLQTQHPVAIHSNDHLYPHGTAHDNTRAPFFIRRCEELFPQKKQLHYMDIGCAGGGLVLDALLRGHFAVGLEGSDFSCKHQRAEWRVLRENLFTCDVTKPFQVLDDQENPIGFDVISGWEVLEHIPQQDVPQVIENIAKHLLPGGIFVGTVSQVHDIDPVSGEDWHVTIFPPEWWEGQFEKMGFACEHERFHTSELARAYGNPPLPWLLHWGIEGSPYIVMRKK